MRPVLRLLTAALAAVSMLVSVACGGSGGGGGLGNGSGGNGGSGTITISSVAPTVLNGCAPTAMTITGTGFQSVSGTTFTVGFHAQGGLTPFAGGASDTATATGIVTSDTTLSATVPPMVLCGVGTVTVAIEVVLESGVSVAGSGAVTFTVNPPTIGSIWAPSVPAAIPTPFTITGTGFAPVGGAVTIRLTADGGVNLFKDGTKPFADVQGIVTGATTVTGTTPIATVCGSASVGASAQLLFPDGCCTPVSAASFLTFVAPTITGVSTPVLQAAVADAAFAVTGTGFGQDGATALVRFVADGGIDLFSDGTAETIDVPAIVSAGGTTLQLRSPLAAVCGVLSRTASLRVVAPYGSSCVTTAPAFLTFLAPTITGAPTPAAVPGSVATTFDVPGTNFGPVGAPAIVRFVADGGALLFDDGTTATVDVPAVVLNATTVRTTTPLVTVCGAANRTAGVRVFSPYGGACVDSGAAYVRFDGPTLTSFSPVPIASTAAASFTVTGTNFGPAGSAVTVRFVADSGTPFGNGSLAAIDVAGTVATGTTVVGTAPTVSACGGGVTASVVVTLSDGSCVASPAAFVTWTGPSITAPTAGAPEIVPASNPPTSITITGTGFAPVGGVARVVFLSDPAGPPIFGDGTQFQSPGMVGTITSSSTITVRPPHATVCGAASRLASIRVELANGSCAASAANVIRYDAPTITAIAAVPPGPILGGVPTPFQITGSNFGPVGSEAIVRFRASAGAPFANGTAQEFDVAGTVTGNTTITGTTPLVALCGVASVTASFRVTFQDGSCADSGATTISWTAPTVTNVNGLTPAVVPSSVPTLVTVNGTGFGPVGGTVEVVFVSDPAGPAIFGDGTLLESAAVQGTIASSTTISVRTPHATVCDAASRFASLRIRLPGGACASSPAQAIRFDAPSITSVGGTPFVGSVSSAFQVNGTNFGPGGSSVTVRFVASSGTPFANGTSATFDVPGVVNAGGTQVAGTTPLVAICGTGDVTASVRVLLQDGSCADSAAGAATFTGPTVTNVNGASPAVVSATNPAAITINGTGFGPVGGFASVVFVSDPAPQPPLFADGTQRESAPVQGQITSATTITVLPPNVTVSNASNRLASVRVTLPGGSCAASAAQAIRFDAPTITSIAATPGPQFLAAVPTPFTITGTNFAPPGSEVLVRFVADGGATPFGNATLSTFDVPGTVNAGGTQITGFTPLAALCPGASVGAAVRLTFQDGTQVQTAATFLTFSAPTVSSFVPATFDGGNPSPSTFTVNGAGFGPVGSLVNVRFAASGGARPFGGGTLSDVIVLGTVTSATTVTGTLPLATVCGAGSVAATATVHFTGGACTSTAVGAITMNAPSFAVSGALVPSSVPSTSSQAFTVTGAGFGPVGQPAFVTFTATSGSPFGNGTLVETTVTGTITSATTITGFSPLAAVCTGSATATVSVRLPNGSCTPTAGAPTMTFVGPTIASTTPVTVATAGLTPTTFTLVGTGFAPLGPVTVRFVSADPVFGDGSQTTYDAVGTVTSSTAISVTTPLARICTPSNTATASVRVLFANGSCADSSGAIVTFNGPVAGSVDGLPPITALNPTPILITGTNFPPVGTPVEVVFTAVSGTPFAAGTNREGHASGFVNPSGFIQVTPPLGDVCPPLTDLSASIALNFGSNRCLTQVPGTVTYRAPTFDALAVSTPANLPGSISITGQYFAAPGSVVTVGFSDTAVNGFAFDNASHRRTTVVGTVSAFNTITVASPPRPASCTANTVSAVDVVFSNFSCDYPVGGTVTFLAPTITSISDNVIETLTPAALTITGTNFGPTGVQVLVRWTSADLIFADGNEASIDLPGTVTSNTTITTVAPLARICPNTTSTADIRVVFPQGSCADSPSPFVTFPGPTFAPNTPSVAALNPGSLTITGASFPPVGTPTTVRLVTIGTPNNPRIFGSGTDRETLAYGVVSPANTVTVSLPTGSVCPPDTAVNVDARVTFGNGSCAEATAATVTYNAPTITTIGAVTRDATEPANLTVNGTNFPPVGTQVVVRFTAGAAYPQLFGNAGLVQAVVGTVTAATSITVRPPAAAVCELTTATASLDVNFGNDPCYYAVPGTFTYQGPAITTVAPNTITSLTAAAVTITGLRFGPTVPANTQVTVRWTSADPIFGDGTLTSVDLPGTIVSSTSITTLSPIARVCAGASSAASLRVIFPMGACATTGSGAANGGVTFQGPSITALAATVDALNPGSVTITGSSFPPVGTPISVTLVAPAGQRPFASGTQNQATVVTQVSPANSISVVLPIGDVPLASSPMTMTVGLDIGNSTCPSAAAGTIDYVAPAIATVGAPVLRDATAPASLAVTGTRFPAVGATAEVRFTSALPIFGNTSQTQTVVGTVTGAGTLTVTPPAAAVCELATADATLEVRFLGNSLFYAVPGTLRYQAPAVSSVVPAAVNAMTPQALTVNGLRFGPTASPTTQVTVRWTSADPIFGDGTLTSVDLPGTITSATTITTTAPLARVCAGATSTATFRLIFAMGACADSGATTVTFTGPSVAAALSGNVNAQNPGSVSVTLNNPPPVGTPIGVTLTAAGNALVFAAGTQAQAQVVGSVGAGGVVSIPLPIADLCTPGSSNAVSVTLDIGNSTCPATSAGTLTYQAPTFTSIGAVTASAGAPPAVLAVAGTNLPADGSPVTVRFTAAAGTPFAGGTQAQATVAGVVSGGGTTISVTPPTATLCETASVATSLEIVLRAGPCSYAVGGTLTYSRPSIAAGTFTTNPVAAASPPAETLSGVTNGPAYAAATAVTVRLTAAAPLFGDGTQSTADVAGVAAAGGGSVSFTPAAGRVCTGTVAVTVRVLYPDGTCSDTTTLTYTAPTLASLSPTTVDALAPVGITLSGANLPPNATVTVRFVAATGTPFESGTSAQAETTGVVDAGGTTITVANVPGASSCQVAATLSASVSVVLVNGCVVTPTTNTLTYTMPTVTSMTPNTLRARFTTGVSTINGANFGNVAVNTAVRVRFASNANVFADGTSNVFETTGFVGAGSTITTEVPDATICGAASAQASVTVFFPDGTCAGATNVLTYQAPQVAGAGATGFVPQNLAYDGSTPFTVIATAGNNDFTNLVGQAVQVEFSVAAGTPFRGGTSAFDVVPGTVASATTVTGSAPNVVAAASTIANVSVRVRFEDGTCTDLATTSYFRADNLLAVAGTGGLTLIATSAANPYGAAANTIVPGTPIAGASVGAGGVAIDPTLNKAFAVNGATVQVVDLAGPAATSGAGAPTLGAAALRPAITLPAAGAGMALDETAHRLYVISNNSFVVIDTRTDTVLTTVPILAFGAATGGIVLDLPNRQALAPTNAPGIIRLDLDTQLTGGVVVVANVGAAVWTQTLALNPSSNQVFLTYDDPGIGADAVAAFDSADLTTNLWTTPLAAGTNPTGVIGVDASFSRVWIGQAGPNDVQSFVIITGVPAAAAAVANATFIVGPGSVADRAYVSDGANVNVIVSSTGAGLGAIVVAGAASEFTTSP